MVVMLLKKKGKSYIVLFMNGYNDLERRYICNCLNSSGLNTVHHLTNTMKEEKHMPVYWFTWL